MIHPNLNINENGHLTVSGQDCVDLAAKYGTPLYLLDEQLVRFRYSTKAVPVDHAAGTLTAEIAEKTGLPAGIPVAVGAGAVPMLGMLMLPKTVCYILLIAVFLRSVTGQEKQE